MENREEYYKQKLVEKAHNLGAGLVRTCSAAKWKDIPIQTPEFWPENIWPWAENVIVLGIPLFAPMVGTTPSMVYQELYDTSNRILDNMAYFLTAWITDELGYRACFFPRDCYYGIEVLEKNPNAAFSHVLAGYYSGMGTIGDSHNLITREYGPRVRPVSVLTDLPVENDEMLAENLCIHCGKCLKSCPAQCFFDSGGRVYDLDKVKCTQQHILLKNQNHWPCGKCIDVCPVGEDMKKYRTQKAVSADGAVHCRNFGS